MISFSRFLYDWTPDVQLSDYHRAKLRRLGVIVAASVLGLNIALVLVAGLAAVWGAF